MNLKEQVARAIAQVRERNGAMPFEAYDKHNLEVLYEEADAILALLHPEGSSAVEEALKPTDKEIAVANFLRPGVFDRDPHVQHRACSPHLVEVVQKRELERARELISLLSSNARERALEEALKRIATDDCGCTPICQCNSESALRVWKEETQQIAKAALRTPDVERPASPVPAGEDEAAWKAFGASEAACIHYPDDTELDRACRAAYIRGAADSAPSLPEWKAIETAPKEELDMYPQPDANCLCCEGGSRLPKRLYETKVKGRNGEPIYVCAECQGGKAKLPAAPTGEE